MDPKLPQLSPSGWTGKERALLVVLVLILTGLFVLRAQTRRPDPSRVPQRPDVLVIHVGGLRSDAAPAETLAVDLGLRGHELLVFPQAFAPSGDGRRSLLSLLAGDLVLNLDAAPGPESLAPTLSKAGWTTLLVAEGELPPGASKGFDHVGESNVEGNALAHLRRLMGASPADRPVLAVVHLGTSDRALHARTTESTALRAEYDTLVHDIRGRIADLARTAWRDRPGLVVLAGASGMELGGHPDAPDRPWDSHLRVPLLIGLRGGAGMPLGIHRAMVQTTDVAPTLLDLLDLRDRATRDADGQGRTGVSLEPLVHGWSRAPVHERLFFADRHHVAVREVSWKLIAPVQAPWHVDAERSQLYSLSEDPREAFDLAADRPLGPVGTGLLQALREQLARPEAAR